MDQSPPSDVDDHAPDTELRHRLRHGQTDLEDAITLLRSLDLDDTPPAANFDAGWGEIPS